MFIKYTILLAAINALVVLAAPANTTNVKREEEIPYFMIKFPKPDTAFPTYDGSISSWDGRHWGPKGSPLKWHAGAEDGVFVYDKEKNPDFLFVIKTGTAARIVGCSAGGQIKKGKTPEFTITDGPSYMTPCGDNEGLVLHCGEYNGRAPDDLSAC